MIITSTIPNNSTLLSTIEHLLKRVDIDKKNEISTLLNIIESGQMSINTVMRMAVCRLQNDQTEKAVSLIEKINFNQSFEDSETVKQADRLLTTADQTGTVDIIFPIVLGKIQKNASKNKFHFLILIRAAQILFLRGDVVYSKQLLSTVDFSIVEALDQLLVLGKTLHRLGMFYQALEVFELIEKEDDSQTQHLFFKANTFLCLHNYEQAMYSIHREIAKNGKSNRALIAKCRLLRYTHRYGDALEIIELLLTKKNNPHSFCVNLIEKGKILRLKEGVDSALIYFQKAAYVEEAKKLWKMVAYFECSISTACLGNIEKAIDIAMEGHSLTVDEKESHYNPCSALKDFLMQKTAFLNSTQWYPDKKNYTSDLWPTGSFPYNLWIDFLCLGLYCYNETLKAERIISKFAADPRIAIDRNVLTAKKKMNKSWLMPENIELVIDALWPHLSSTQYRNLLVKLMGNTILS